MKKILVSLIGLVLSFCLCACSPFEGNINESLKAPQPTGEPFEIQQALSKIIGNVDYCYPREGKYRSAVIINDISGDGENEAFVLYSTETDDKKTIVHISMVQKVENQWIVTDDMELDANVVISVDFAVMQTNTNCLVIYSNHYGTKSNQITINSLTES